MTRNASYSWPRGFYHLKKKTKFNLTSAMSLRLNPQCSIRTRHGNRQWYGDTTCIESDNRCVVWQVEFSNRIFTSTVMWETTVRCTSSKTLSPRLLQINISTPFNNICPALHFNCVWELGWCPAPLIMTITTRAAANYCLNLLRLQLNVVNICKYCIELCWRMWKLKQVG